MSQLFPLKKNTKITVLLIDDELKLLETLKSYLQSKGISVLCATSVLSAFNIMANIIPDVLIVDIMMPHENGYDFIAKLKENKRFANIPFIFLTAKGMAKDRVKAYSLGCRAYITKPFDPEELVSVIVSIINDVKDIENIRQIKAEIKKIRYSLENKNKNYVLLTGREKIILYHILQGKTNLAIADKMKITLRNVERYVTRLLNKTGTRNRVDLVRFSYRFYNSLRANDENRTRE